jgi:hypothetical protein
MIEEGHKLLDKYLEEKIYETITIKMEGKELFLLIHESYNSIKNYMFGSKPFSFFKKYLEQYTNQYDKRIDKYFFTKILYKIFDQKPEISDFNMHNHGFSENLVGPDDMPVKTNIYLTDRFIPDIIGAGSNEVFKMLNGEYRVETKWCKNAVMFYILDMLSI